MRPGETGWLVRAGQRIEDVTQSALAELADPGRRDEIARACRQWAARFDWDNSAAELADLVGAAVRPDRGMRLAGHPLARRGGPGEPPVTEVTPAGGSASAVRARWQAWPGAVVRTARPRQWPKNLLVFAAPLAGASLGRDEGFAYGLAAFAAFAAASSAVYFVNDVADAALDRAHPVKRNRPVASGQLPKPVALAVAAGLAVAAEATGAAIGEPRLCAVVGAYLALSLLYCAGLKRLPVAELILVTSGFVLRAVGGAIATHVPPSGWFLLVCSLGALLVAIAKRSVELHHLGGNGAAHRPVLRWYPAAGLRAAQRTLSIVMLGGLCRCGQSASPAVRLRSWHVASAVPLALALLRFEQLSAGPDGTPVEDLIARDLIMVGCEVAWLALFVAGL